MIFNQYADGRKVRQFSLSSAFLDDFRDRQPAWGPIGYFTYKRTYARLMPDGTTEEFWQTCQRVVEGAFNIQKIHCHQMGLPWNEHKAQVSAQDMFERMWDFKFSPPGRGLSVMGTDIVYQRGSASLQNCFRGSEKLITKEYGPVAFADVVGEKIHVLHPDQTWHMATVSCFGEQPVQRVTFAPANPNSRGKGYRRARSNLRVDVTVTPDHRWILASGDVTTSLGVGDVVRAGFTNPDSASGDYQEGMQHGLIFGDGTAGYQYANGDRQFHIRLCGEKAQSWVHLFSDVHQLPSYNGDPWCCVRKSENWKDFPLPSKSLDYMAGFLFGWVVADSTYTNQDSVLLCSQHPGAETWLKTFAASAGYLLTGHNVDSTATTNFGPRSDTMNRFTLVKRDTTFWKVESVIDLEEPEFVYCATVPDVGSFVLASGIHTGNCAFVSTSALAEDFAGPFCFLMDMSMLGVGTGADTKGAGKVKLSLPKVTTEPYVVGDSREGWVDLIRMVINSFAGKGSFPQTIDYSQVRGRGEPLKTFGGTASGPKPLHDLVVNIVKLLVPDTVEVMATAEGENDWATISKAVIVWEGTDTPYRVTSTQIVDIFNFIGKAVVAGGIRRTAEIMFGEPEDADFMAVKDPSGLRPLYTKRGELTQSLVSLVGSDDPYAVNVADLAPEKTDAFETLYGQFVEVDAAIKAHPLNDRRWASNNSIYARVGMDYTAIAAKIADNGEPGIVWLDTAKKFSRMADAPDNKDWRIAGTNPCGEQGLESYELCNLVETYPAHHESYEDFEKTLKMAYLYAKTVTLVPTHDPRANAVMMRNRRIGASMSGIVQAVQKFGRREFFNWCDHGYKYIQKMDRVYSDWLGIPLSVKTTTVKPSGTVSLLCGATPGIHFPHSEYYIRHVRVGNQSPLCDVARKAGLPVFPDMYADNTSVVAFPVKEKHFLKGKSDVSLWEQFVLSADMQKHWSDNLVSATVTFSKAEVGDIKTCLESFETRLKGVSLLPLLEEDHGYAFPPYQTSTKEEYDSMMAHIGEMSFDTNVHDTDERFCEGDKCLLPVRN